MAPASKAPSRQPPQPPPNTAAPNCGPTRRRFARGTGGPSEARALGALYYDLKRVGVAIRTGADDEYLSNEMLVGFASAQAAKYSRDLSESVTRAKRRQAERGEHLGGPMPLGYRLAEKKWVVVDPETAPLVKRIFELASQASPTRPWPARSTRRAFAPARASRSPGGWSSTWSATPSMPPGSSTTATASTPSMLR